MSIRTQITENSARLRAMHAEIERAFAEEPRGPAHAAACTAFHREYNALAFPGGLEHFLERLKRLEPPAVEEAIEFLEAEPWFYRSGYIKEEIVRRLKKVAVTERQRNRLAAVVLRSTNVGTRRLSLHLARLARIVDSPTFRQRVESLLRSSGETRHRAKHLWDVLGGCRNPASGLDAPQ